MDDDNGYGWAYQCEIEQQQYELMQLEEEYKFYLQEDKYERV